MWHFLFLRKGVTGHMEKLVKVAVDAMGGDHAPGEVVKGAVDAVNEKNNLKVFLVGKAPRIHEELSKYQYKNEQIEVVNAEEEISCDESPVEAIRKKKDSSMVVALKMVKDKTADAFVSAGSSGAILVGGQFVVGRIKGIKRAPHLLHFTSVGAVIFQFALRLFLLPLDDLFFGQIDIGFTPP